MNNGAGIYQNAILEITKLVTGADRLVLDELNEYIEQDNEDVYMEMLDLLVENEYAMLMDWKDGVSDLIFYCKTLSEKNDFDLDVVSIDVAIGNDACICSDIALTKVRKELIKQSFDLACMDNQSDTFPVVVLPTLILHQVISLASTIKVNITNDFGKFYNDK